MSIELSDLLMPLAICAARVADVTLGTLRTVAVVRGRPVEAAVLGFLEVTIWVLAAGRVLTSLDNPLNVLAWATGFALGNAAGIAIEKKLALGRMTMRIISRDKGAELAEALRGKGLRVTEFEGRGKLGPVSMLYVLLDRADADETERLVERLDDDVFVAFDESRGVNRSVHPTMGHAAGWRSLLRK